MNWMNMENYCQLKQDGIHSDTSETMEEFMGNEER